MARILRGLWLGRRRYEPVHRLQQRLHDERRAGRIGDSVLFVEHEPVITLGRGAAAEHLLVSPRQLAAAGVDLVEVSRGGDITLHAPGQLVCYPILDLSPERRDVRRYVRDLTETMRRLALDWAVVAEPFAEHIGLWVQTNRACSIADEAGEKALAKLGAIGVRISRWVTMHGFAFNLTTDLELYGMIVPCGIRHYGVTSIEALTGQRPRVRDAAGRAFRKLAEVFEAHADGLSNFETESLDAVVCDEARALAP